jgi:hypothetical protein
MASLSVVLALTVRLSVELKKGLQVKKQYIRHHHSNLCSTNRHVLVENDS